MNEVSVVEYGIKMADAMVTLRNAKQSVPSLMLAYAAIDQMAWLNIAKERSTGADFKAWVSKYILPQLPGDVTADELWEARNGLLHMGTADSDANRNSSTIRKIYYTIGSAECSVNRDPNSTFINTDHLYEIFAASVFTFAEDLKKNPDRLAKALEKLGRILSQRDLEP